MPLGFAVGPQPDRRVLVLPPPAFLTISAFVPGRLYGKVKGEPSAVTCFQRERRDGPTELVGAVDSGPESVGAPDDLCDLVRRRTASESGYPGTVEVVPNDESYAQSAQLGRTIEVNRSGFDRDSRL